MKIQFKQSSIIDAISNACTVIPSKSTMPIIRNLKLEAKDNIFYIYATDSEIEFTTSISDNINIVEDGLVLVDGNKLLKILQEVGEGDFELIAEDNYINITGLGCEFKINTVDPEEYPNFQTFSGKPTLDLPGISLKTMIDKTVFATRDEPSRYQMNGILIKGSGNRFDLVATDTKRLALVTREIENEVNVEDGEDGINAILPTKFVTLLQKTLTDNSAQLKIEGNTVKVKTQNTTISSRLVNGIFPDYQNAIPNCDFEAKINRNDLLSSIKKATIFTSEVTRSVKFYFQKDLLLIHSSMPEAGEAHISMPIEYNGDSIEMNFNPGYLMEGLRAINDESITIELKDPKRPAILKGDTNYSYLIMPVLARE